MDDLFVGIYPRGYVEWRGTSAQLLAEGLLPAEFVWPRRAIGVEWTSGTFDYWLRRCRPDDLDAEQHGRGRHPWVLRRRATADRGDGFAAARRFTLRQQCEEMLWLQTPAGQRQRRDAAEAQRDEHFRAFLLGVLRFSR